MTQCIALQFILKAHLSQKMYWRTVWSQLQLWKLPKNIWGPKERLTRSSCLSGRIVHREAVSPHVPKKKKKKRGELSWLHLLRWDRVKVGDFADRRSEYCCWHARGWKWWIKTTTSGSLPLSSLPPCARSQQEALFTGCESTHTPGLKKNPSLLQEGSFCCQYSPWPDQIHLVIGPLMLSGHSNWEEMC